MRRDDLDALRNDVHVGPDVTAKVMERLGFRPVPRKSARLRRFLHVATCLAVIAGSIVGVAWVIDLGWRSRLAGDPSARRASNPDVEAARGRWDAIGESLRPLRRIVDEIEPQFAPAPEGVPSSPSMPPVWLSARAPLGEA